MRVPWRVAVALFLGAGACSPHLVRKDVAKTTWVEVSGEHVTLVTDLPLATAQERWRNFEELRNTLIDHYRLLLPGFATVEESSTLVLFRRCERFWSLFDASRRAYSETRVGGIVVNSADFAWGRVIYTCDRIGGRDEVILHELAHVVNGKIFSLAPAWLNEGLATYFQTLGVEDGRVILGRPSGMDARALSGNVGRRRVRELVELDYAEFRRTERRDYFEAWKLVHLLNNGRDEDHARFRRYLELLAGGAGPEESWEGAFGDADLEELDARFRTYHHRRKFPVWTRDYEVRPPARAAATRTLHPAEAHLLWARAIATVAGRDDDVAVRRAIESHLEIAAEAADEVPAVLFWKAILETRLAEDDPDVLERATSLLREYVRRRSQDARAWAALVQIRTRAVLPADADDLEEAPSVLRSLENDVHALLRVAHQARELEVVGRYFARTGRPEIGLNFAQRALVADPGCARCLDTLALVLYRSGRVEEALEAQRRAVGLAAKSGVPEDWRTRLEHYEAEARDSHSSSAP